MARNRIRPRPGPSARHFGLSAFPPHRSPRDCQREGEDPTISCRAAGSAIGATWAARRVSLQSPASTSAGMLHVAGRLLKSVRATPSSHDLQATWLRRLAPRSNRSVHSVLRATPAYRNGPNARICLPRSMTATAERSYTRPGDLDRRLPEFARHLDAWRVQRVNYGLTKLVVRRTSRCPSLDALASTPPGSGIYNPKGPREPSDSALDPPNCVVLEPHRLRMHHQDTVFVDCTDWGGEELSWTMTTMLVPDAVPAGTCTCATPF